MRGIRTGRVTNRNYPFSRKGERESMRLLFGRHGIVSTSLRIIAKVGSSADAPIQTSCTGCAGSTKIDNNVLRWLVDFFTIISMIVYLTIVFACSMFVPCVLIVLISGSFVPVFIMLAAGVVGGILIGIYKKKIV